MAQLFSTGPAQLYVTIDSLATDGTMADLLTYPEATSIFFLGTCERAPSIETVPFYRELKANIGGLGHPFDRVFMREKAMFTGILNKWNEVVYDAIAARDSTSNSGSYDSNAVGRPQLLSGRGAAMCLWVNFPFSAKSAYSTQPDGYRFPGAIFLGPDGIVPGAGSKRLLVFECLPVYKRADGTWKLYDHTFTNIPTVPPIVATGAVV